MMTEAQATRNVRNTMDQIDWVTSNGERSLGEQDFVGLASWLLRKDPASIREWKGHKPTDCIEDEYPFL